MARRFRSVGLAAAGAVLVAACGGGAVLAVLGTLGAGGGDWLVDASPDVAGYEPRRDCGGDLCAININPGSLFDLNYAVRGSGNFGGCSANPAPEGRVSNGVDVNVPGCFVGRLISVNEGLSNDGRLRVYFDFSPDLFTGIWVDIHDSSHRFVFDDNLGNSCEIAGTVRRPLTYTVQRSNFRSFADGSANTLIGKTSLSELTIQGTPVRRFVGEFVGASGLRLTRAGEQIEIQRQPGNGSCQ